jgi:hypothetical protein
MLNGLHISIRFFTKWERLKINESVLVESETGISEGDTTVVSGILVEAIIAVGHGV